MAWRDTYWMYGHDMTPELANISDIWQWTEKNGSNGLFTGSTKVQGKVGVNSAFHPSGLGKSSTVPACLAGVKAGCVHLCRVEGNTV